MRQAKKPPGAPFSPGTGRISAEARGGLPFGRVRDDASGGHTVERTPRQDGPVGSPGGPAAGVRPPPSRWLHAALHVLAGGGGLVGAGWIHALPNAVTHWRLLEEPLFATGLIVGLLALLRRRPRVARFSTGLCLALLVTSLTVVLLEIGFRLARFDFRGLEAGRRLLPPFYRKPTVPTGGTFFRRAGPDHWRGQVIRTCLRVVRLPEAPYREEPVVEVRYDAQGFRNEGLGERWEVAVAGDSFTELGFLPYDQLFTSVLARLTGWRVRNLGVSHTGPLTQLSYLADYGFSAATHDVVIVLYEGNDFTDLDRERLAVAEFERTGRYELEEFRRQSSFLRAVADLIARPAPLPVPARVEADALWVGPDGEVPLTLENTAPAAADLAAETRASFQHFLARYAALAKERRARPWLAYMPCKLRVLWGRARLTETGAAAVGKWSPTDLPVWVAERCATAGVAFVDLTPALTEALQTRRQLPYNAIYDTHLNFYGAEVVGRTLAQALRPAPP